MLKQLISLVFLFIALTFVKAYPDTTSGILPKAKPKEIFKSVNKVKTRNILPLKKPTLQKFKVTKTKEILPKNKPSIENKVKGEKTVEVVKEKKLPLKSLNIETTEIVFLLPKKKPVTYKTIASKEALESKVLSKKDYAYAKEIFINIKEKKWTSVFRTTKNIKDKDFKNLISWIYLK